MKVLLQRCAGLDVHKETVVACARRMVGQRVEYVLEQCGTTKSELLRLAEWLHAQGLDAEIARHLEPFRSQLQRLSTIPGVSDYVASVLIAEIGTDMSRFPSAGHLIAWAGLCPRMDESAGKRRNTRTRKGARWLRSTLVHAAWPAARSKGSYLQAQFLRLKSRRGPKKAAVAVAASILTAAYHIFWDDGVVYLDLGGTTSIGEIKTGPRDAWSSTSKTLAIPSLCRKLPNHAAHAQASVRHEFLQRALRPPIPADDLPRSGNNWPQRVDGPPPGANGSIRLRNRVRGGRAGC